MPEQLATADGTLIDIDPADAAFAAAMAAPRSDEPVAAAPPPLDPEAPFGRKVDGTPKARPGGRPPKARVTAVPAAAAPGAAAAKAGPADYTGGLTEFSDGLWLALAATPAPGDLRIRLRAQAAVLKANQGGLVQSVNLMAQNNASVRWAVEKVTTGNGAWLLPAMFAAAPFAVQTAQVWRVPVAGDLARLADQTEREWAEMFAGLKAELDLAAVGDSPAASPGAGAAAGAPAEASAA